MVIRKILVHLDQNVSLQQVTTILSLQKPGLSTGMRALLIYYLTQHFLYSDDEAFLIYGAYTALVYLMPVFGGIFADQFLGSRKAVTVGAILMVIGQLGLTITGPEAMESVADGARVIERDPVFLNGFFLSLALIVTGVGFLKTNISTVVGLLYGKNDPRRDGQLPGRIPDDGIDRDFGSGSPADPVTLPEEADASGQNGWGRGIRWRCGRA